MNDEPRQSPDVPADGEEASELTRGYAAVAPAARELFDAEFLGQLEYLRIVSRRAFAGVQPASRRGLKPGPGLEFSAHRPYAEGDDFRYLDWAAYGRLDRLLLRLFQQDEDLAIAILVDVSDSMLAGAGPSGAAAGAAAGAPTRGGHAWRKVDHARRLAAALAYIGLSNLDRIRLMAFAGGEAASLRTRRGCGQIFSVLDFLAGAPLGGQTDLRRATDQLQQHMSERGLVAVISDFLGRAPGPAADNDAATHLYGFEDGLGRLHYQGHEVWAILVEAPEEIHPPLESEVELVDAETGRAAQLRVTPERVARYLEQRDAFLRHFDRWTTERGIAHLRARTDVAADELVLDVMRRGGFVK